MVVTYAQDAGRFDVEAYPRFEDKISEMNQVKARVGPLTFLKRTNLTSRIC